MTVNVPMLLERLGIRGEPRGRDIWACCPFHEERTPSWHIRNEPGNEKHGQHICHGCEVGGSAVFLVMRMLDLPAGEAWRLIQSDAPLQAQLRMHVRVEVGATKKRRFQLPPLVIIGRPLERWPSEAQRYLAKRGVDQAELERWEIGYAVDGRLAGRIVIPVRNGRGEYVSYTARAFGASPLIKYKEPLEEEFARKDAIFGEWGWPAHVERDVVVVVEGGFNALAVQRATGHSFAALFGSEYMPSHGVRLSTFKRVVIASDPDKAGEKMRTAMRALSRWTQVLHVKFPTGMDANDIAMQEDGQRVLADLVNSVL